MPDCSTCNGDGSVICHACDNDEEKIEECLTCNGDGYVECTFCYGTGQVDTDDDTTLYPDEPDD